ncbi:pyridoxamine 5'-phosphate oxidase family protein [Acidipila sp. EB88]|uniref:pyridoxamine 5'-phosphate oxidase family protein n=1 Tax=Acidipila sp. EB88 TaxID=2305226 RepID=UPI0013151074|nr:pyridoxamine 5'-phosphate oxidase family protein [Acidipila sp. EB88]
MSAGEEIENREEAIDKIAGLIKDIHVAMLTTIHADGTLHSRPMATQNTPFNGEVVFLTAEHSGKVDEIKQDAEVGLCYSDAKHAFVTMRGRATLSDDRALIAALWNPLYKAWFPEGESDPNIRVLRVKVEQAEFWNAPASAVMRKVQVLTRAATGGKTPVGEHAQVSL